MSIQNNTTALQALLEQVNALPNASSGGTVEIVTLTIYNNLDYTGVRCLYYNGTELITGEFGDSEKYITINLAKNSIFYFAPDSIYGYDVELLNGDVRSIDSSTAGLVGYLVASSDATFNIVERSGGLEG